MSEKNEQKRNNIYKEIYKKCFTKSFENVFEKLYTETLKKCEENLCLFALRIYKKNN